jgi:hypothetical protein
MFGVQLSMGGMKQLMKRNKKISMSKVKLLANIVHPGVYYTMWKVFVGSREVKNYI